MGVLEGKVAAITGGTRGIGRGVAEAFLREGAGVAINGRDHEKEERALAEIGAGDACRFFAGDVTKKDDIERFVDSTVEVFGAIDILVNNAGGATSFAPLFELDDAAWQQAIDGNLNSTF